ncbi:transposable element Tcb1 transposase [Trichonephila clavipes]|nr:transposable element Tcb1 transposase [Trichonephila clavipes]
MYASSSKPPTTATSGFRKLYYLKELWFQQDGATCHTARATIDLLKDTFGDRLISRFGPVNWPPRSCDLTPLDYFLWGYVKSLVYADKPQTLDHLEDNIRRVIADIRPQMLEKVIENWMSKLDYIRASRDSHMPEIIFKINASWGSNFANPFLADVYSMKGTYLLNFKSVGLIVPEISRLVSESVSQSVSKAVVVLDGTKNTVMLICDRSMPEATTDRRGRSHPPQCATSREDRQIVRMAVTDCSVTSWKVAQHIESVTHHSVSARTIRRRLQQSGMSARRPLLRLPFSQNHKRFRRQWCDERSMWVAEWNKFVFTDDSRICLQHHDGRIRVWRHRVERMMNRCIMRRHTAPAPGIMVLGGIGNHSPTPLGRIAGTLNNCSTIDLDYTPSCYT